MPLDERAIADGADSDSLQAMARGNASDASDSSRLRGIEGLRAIAASSILVYHVWLYGAPGGAAVDLGGATKVFENLRAGVTLFFVLSGFLLFRPYVAAAWTGGRTPRTGRYLLNRALRILPAYWVVLFVVAVLLERGLLDRPWQLLANVFFLQNYVPGYVFGQGIVPAWSLTIEVVFYLAVPVLGGIAIRLARRHGVPALAAALVPVALMVAIGVAAKVATSQFDGGAARVWQVTFLTHADWFAAGMAVAVLHVRWANSGGELFRGWRPVALATAALLLAVSMKSFYSGRLSGLEYQSPIAVSCALVLAVVVFPGSRGLGARILGWRPLHVAGLASYSLFLWHDPLVRAFRNEGWTVGGSNGFLVNLAVLGTVSAVAAALTYRLVERPALALKRGWQGAGASPKVAQATAHSVDPGALRPVGAEALREPGAVPVEP